MIHPLEDTRTFKFFVLQHPKPMSFIQEIIWQWNRGYTFADGRLGEWVAMSLDEWSAHSLSNTYAPSLAINVQGSGSQQQGAALAGMIADTVDKTLKANQPVTVPPIEDAGPRQAGAGNAARGGEKRLTQGWRGKLGKSL